jgi:hypothetical protein
MKVSLKTKNIATIWPGMVMHNYYPSTFGRLKQEDWKFKASLYYIARLSQKKKEKTKNYHIIQLFYSWVYNQNMCKGNEVSLQKKYPHAYVYCSTTHNSYNMESA